MPKNISSQLNFEDGDSQHQLNIDIEMKFEDTINLVTEGMSDSKEVE